MPAARPARLLPLALLGLLAARPAAADRWTALGPPGGDVRSLAADPRDPRGGHLGPADGGPHRSGHAGQRWSRLDPGFPARGMSLDDLVVGPDGSLLVAYWEVQGPGGGVARSADGGRTFTVLAGLAGQGVRALAQAAGAPEVLVAGTLDG